MLDNSRSFIRGMVTGAVVGATFSMMYNNQMGPGQNKNIGDNTTIKRKARKVMRAVGDTFEDLMDMGK